MKSNKSISNTNFQNIIKNLQDYWNEQGCTVLPSFDQEVGAGTLSPYTALHAVTKKEISMCYVQISSRPTDTRFGEDSNRSSSYYQFQVLLKPMYEFGNIQNLFLNSLRAIGLNLSDHDLKFVEDDWKNESIGAYGLGYEVWYDGMEIAQFTYMQAIGGIECQIISCELTYGLERIAMQLQEKSSIFDIVFSITQNGKEVLYSDIHTKQTEIQRSLYNSSYTKDTEELQRQLEWNIETGMDLLKNKQVDFNTPLVLPAYRKCLTASHLLNILETRGIISTIERRDIILKIKKLCQECIKSHLKLEALEMQEGQR